MGEKSEESSQKIRRREVSTFPPNARRWERNRNVDEARRPPGCHGYRRVAAVFPLSRRAPEVKGDLLFTIPRAQPRDMFAAGGYSWLEKLAGYRMLAGEKVIG